MNTENDALFLIITALLIFVAVFSAGCTSGGFSETGEAQNTDIAYMQESLPEFSEPVGETESPGFTEQIQNSSAGPDELPKANVLYTPLWNAGTVASDTNKKSYCLITKMIPETSEYYIMNLMSPPAGGFYVYKDSSFGGMGSKYQASDIDEKYPLFIGTALKIPVYAPGSSTTIVAFLENDTKESMYMNRTVPS